MLAHIPSRLLRFLVYQAAGSGFCLGVQHYYTDYVL